MAENEGRNGTIESVDFVEKNDRAIYMLFWKHA